MAQSLGNFKMILLPLQFGQLVHTHRALIYDTILTGIQSVVMGVCTVSYWTGSIMSS